MDNDTPVGERIAHYRTQRRMSRRVLAELVDRSESWLEKIEYGQRVLDSISMLEKLARALKVHPRDLMPKLGMEPNGGAPSERPKGMYAVDRAVRAIRRLPDRQAPPVVDLRADVERAFALDLGGFYESLVVVLPDLLSASRLAAAQEVPGAWESLAGTYILCSDLARTLHEDPLAWVAADRAVDAALRSGDALLLAKAERLLANALMREDRHDEAGSVLSDTLDAIAPTRDTGPEGWSVWGSVNLTGAVAAVRSGDVEHGRRMLGDAWVAADRVGPGRNDYWEAFGPANVRRIELAVALEVEDPIEALRVAQLVQIDDLPSAGRRARLCIYIAQASALRANDEATVAWLLVAKQHAPQDVRYSGLARELVWWCLRRAKSRTPGLHALVDHLHITS